MGHYTIHFSPTGGTRRVADILVEGLQGEYQQIDLCHEIDNIDLNEGDIDKKCYKRLHRYRFSPPAAYGNNEVHIHPYEPRRISVAEALAIQSLPREYEIPADTTLTNAFKTIGNGVPFLAA